MTTNYNVGGKVANSNEQTVFYTIPIARYVNRITNKKAPNSKGELRLEVLKQKILVKQSKSQLLQWVEVDEILTYHIDKIQQIQKPQDKYTLLKIQLSIVSDKDRAQKCITFRILNINLGRQSTSFIRKKLNQIKNLPNYVSIEEKQAIIMKSIILKEPEYYEVFKKAQEKRMLSFQDSRTVSEFQKVLLTNHPEIKSFNLLKHTFKYEQQKNILVQRLKMNSMQVEGDSSRKRNSLGQRINRNKMVQTNIDKMMIEQDLQKVKKQGKQWLEGYSSKRQFEGCNLAGGDQQLYAKDGLVGSSGIDSNEIKKQNLIIKNINLDKGQIAQLFEDNQYGYADNNSIHRSLSKNHVFSDNQKMEIQEGQISDKAVRPNSKGICQKIKIPDSKDVRFEQKKDQFRSDKKNDINFIDPSYDPQRQLFLTKVTVIWCRLFYHYLKEGGIQKRQKQLTAIETELKLLKNSQQDTQMNNLVGKMVDKVSFNYLRMKRGLDVY